MPLFVLFAGLLATALVSLEYHRAVAARNELRFQNQVQYLENRIADRVETTLALLHAAAGMFGARGEPSREEFRAFVERLMLRQRYPGIHGIGWSRRLTAGEKPAVEQAQRAQGQAGFRVWPDEAGFETHAILYLEPLDKRNEAALGFNMFSEARRRAAMERARDEGRAVASAQLTLVQEIEGPRQAGFLIYAPVYEGGMVPPTVELRRARLAGFVYSPIRVGDFLDAMFVAAGLRSVGIEAYDGNDTAEENLIYRYRGERHAAPRFAARQSVSIAGRPWTVVFTSEPEFEQTLGPDAVPLVAIGGIFLSLLLSGITWTLVLGRRRADLAAETLRRSQHELSLQREWLRTTLASIGDAVIATDLRGRITYLNPVAEALTGWRWEEALERPSEQIFHVLDEATGESAENPVYRVMGGERVEGPATHALLVARDGTQRPIDDSAAPIRDEAGKVTGVVLVFRDVSDRRRVEEARMLAAVELKRSQDRLHLALEAAHMAVWEWHIPSGSLRESQEMGPLLGRKPGWSHSDYESLLADIHHADRARVDDMLAAAISQCREFESEFRVVWPDGSTHWLGARGQVVPGEGAHPAIVVGVLFDIEARKHAEEVLHETARSKDVFLAVLAHELRNPLATISNTLTVMKMSEPVNPSLARLRQMAERQMEHLVRLVDDMLEVSRMTQGKIRLVKKTIELGEVVNDALETCRPLFNAAGHRLTLELSPEPLYLHADPVRITQVVANLLNNAAKYTPKDGEIWLVTERRGGCALVRVRDNGIGIAAEMLPRVFELFVQAEAQPGQTQGGMGIGLTLVKALVEMHGGRIEARSAGLGQGSEFIVTLPLAAEPPKGKETEMHDDVTTEGASRRVLVVDDNEDSAESVGVVVEMLGHDVQVAHDGPSALAQAASYRPEVVLLDIGLPGMDGYEVARRMKAVAPDAVLAAMTGWGGEDDLRRCREAGFHHHLLKPVDIDTLSAILAGTAARE